LSGVYVSERRAGIRVVAVGNKELADLFQITKLITVIPIYPTLEEAMAA